MSSQVFFVNGPATAGKDSLVDLIIHELAKRGIGGGKFSSIDPVKGLLGVAGVDISAKSEKDRTLLSEIGLSLEKHSGFRSNAVYRRIVRGAQYDCMVTDQDDYDATDYVAETVLFVFVREAWLINRVIKLLVAEERRTLPLPDVAQLFVERPGVETITSNESDASVSAAGSDIIVQNDGTIEDLGILANALAGFIADGNLTGQPHGTTLSAKEVGDQVRQAITNALGGLEA